jgi:hypothetical protein
MVPSESGVGVINYEMNVTINHHGIGIREEVTNCETALSDE